MREKAELAILQASVETVDMGSASDDRDGHGTAADSESKKKASVDTTADKSMKQIHAVLDSMLGKLKVKIDSTEKVSF